MIYKLKEVAKQLGLPYETLRKKAQRMTIRFFKIGREWMIDEETYQRLQEGEKR